MEKVYNILLDDNLIGTTRLEKADASMGVVFGEITFLDMPSPCDFFKLYCRANGIEFDDYSDDTISARTIPGLKVTDQNGNEISGLGNNVLATNSDPSELTIEYVPYPFFGEEFPYHVKENEERFK